jgi:hypothetical protein
MANGGCCSDDESNLPALLESGEQIEKHSKLLHGLVTTKIDNPTEQEFTNWRHEYESPKLRFGDLQVMLDGHLRKQCANILNKAGLACSSWDMPQTWAALKSFVDWAQGNGLPTFNTSQEKSQAYLMGVYVKATEKYLDTVWEAVVEPENPEDDESDEAIRKGLMDEVL